ncbi:MAG: carboxymethylenebutenolidase [Alphaproteobacteria bacterium]|nr:carboxymethylenebutenolidase [Alphaproteobacteria bacterium]
MAIQKRPVPYEHDGNNLEGVLVFDDALAGARPLVLVAHAWAGRTGVEVDAAARLAAMGYAGFALDLYGKGVVGTSTEECQALMTPFMADRAKLHARLKASLKVAGDQPEADAANAAAMGFCFGGLCALDLARIGADVKGVASFHGLFMPPETGKVDKIKSKVIAFHGYDDPMAKPADMTALGDELTAAGADWQIHAYGGVMHAFTNPQANDPGFGTVYDKRAADRAWRALEGFLEECLG